MKATVIDIVSKLFPVLLRPEEIRKWYGTRHRSEFSAASPSEMQTRTSVR